MKRDFAQQFLIAAVLMKLQRKIRGAFRQCTLFAVEANADGKGRSTGHQMVISHIASRTQAMQPDSHFRLRVMKAERALMAQVPRAEEQLFERASQLLKNLHSNLLLNRSLEFE